MSAYGDRLFREHAAMLAASAVPPDLARARGYVSVDTKSRLEELGFGAQQRRVPGLLLPLRDRDGKCVGFQYRPDGPRLRDGRPVKYETVPGQANRLDVPPGVGPMLGDPAVDLWVTEGAKKADSAAAVGLACVSLSGVWAWRGTNGEGGKTALPDWADVALNGRRVVLAFDSDVMRKPSVRQALVALAAYLVGKGARIAVCNLPDAADGKTGLDDFLAAGHTREDLERLVEAQPAGTPVKESVASALVRMALADFRLAVSTDGEPFAVPLSGPTIVRPLRGGRESLRAALAGSFYDRTTQVAGQQALTEALLVLEGKAQKQDAERLHMRVGEHAGTSYVDVGDPTGRAIAVTAAGWKVVQAPPILFRRTQLTGALPEPVTGGSLDELWRLLNVAERDRPLLLAWLVAALTPDVPHAVLAIRGEHGSGKTTFTRTVGGLLDPSPAPTRKPPRDADAWVTAAAGSWVVAVDNVSAVSAWWSDALCRACTGDGDVRRRLYSDSELTVFAFRRVILLNGIDLGAIRDDLADRLLTVELERIGERGRRLDGDLAAEWADAYPRVLGALFDLAVQVFAALPGLRLERLPRMADFAKVLAAVDQVCGTDGLRRYLAQAGDLATDAVDSDPVLAAITSAVRQPWVGTAAEMLERITPNADERRRVPKDWPQNPRALTGLLRRRGPALRRLGWAVDDLGRGGRDKLVRFALTPPPAAGTAGDDAGDSPAVRATLPAPRATSAPVARITTVPRPAETAFNDPNAGDAGDRNTAYDPWEVEVRGEGPEPPPFADPVRDGPFTSPASPATVADLGKCVRSCGRTVRRYGDQADPVCPDCREQMQAAS